MYVCMYVIVCIYIEYIYIYTLLASWASSASSSPSAADPSKTRLPARNPHATQGRQRLLLLLLLLLCPQRHGPPGRGNTMALKDERSPKYAFPEAGTSLLKSPTKSLLAAAAAGAADPSKRRLPARKPHATEGRRKDTALPDGATPWPWRTNGVQNRCFPGPERPFWNLLEAIRFSMLATGSCCCCCCWCSWPFKKAASGKETPCYWRATATAAAAAVPTKTRPSRTGKHHGPEERTESKICISRGRNVPSEISYKKLASCCWCSWPFKKAASGKETPCYWRTPERPFWNLLQKLAIRFWLLARCELLHCCRCAYCCVCLCLLRPTDACCCLLLPAAAFCLLLPAAPCCCAHKDTALPDGETPWPWRTNGVQNRRFPGRNIPSEIS